MAFRSIKKVCDVTGLRGLTATDCFLLTRAFPNVPFVGGPCQRANVNYDVECMVCHAKYSCKFIFKMNYICRSFGCYIYFTFNLSRKFKENL